MADRRITHSGKDPDGVIVALCNPRQDWSPRRRADAVNDITARVHRYYVERGRRRTYVHVYRGQYLRTEPDSATGNNLDDLPDC